MRTAVAFAASPLFSAALLAALTGCSQTRVSEPVGMAPATQPAAAVQHDYGRWEKEIAAYEAKDRTHPPAKGGIVFIGSSTIRMWKTLETDFPDHHVMNRGFGGSEIADSTYFADRIIFPYEPRMVVLRAGGNDIHAGKTPEQVFADYQAFVARVHARLPKAQIVYIALCPAPSRWAERDANKALNSLVQKHTRRHAYLKYVETYQMSLDSEGQARRELFLDDQLHFNAEGYRILADLVRPALAR